MGHEILLQIIDLKYYLMHHVWKGCAFGELYLDFLFCHLVSIEVDALDGAEGKYEHTLSIFADAVVECLLCHCCKL